MSFEAKDYSIERFISAIHRCNRMMSRLVERMQAKQGVTERLKAENPMLWVGKMNNIRQCQEEMVLRELVYV